MVEMSAVAAMSAVAGMSAAAAMSAVEMTNGLEAARWRSSDPAPIVAVVVVAAGGVAVVAFEVQGRASTGHPDPKGLGWVEVVALKKAETAWATQRTWAAAARAAVERAAVERAAVERTAVAWRPLERVAERGRRAAFAGRCGGRSSCWFRARGNRSRIETRR
jgi:hypothetical protein